MNSASLERGVLPPFPLKPTTLDAFLPSPNNPLWCSPLSTGCEMIDGFLKGGIHQGLTEVAGEAGTCKSSFALQLAVRAQLPHRLGGLNGGCFYVCTEGAFPSDRFSQIVNGLHAILPQQSDVPSVASIMDNTFIRSVASLQELQEVVFKTLNILVQQRNIKLVVVDSIAALFRISFTADATPQRARAMAQVAQHLCRVSAQFALPVVVLNQVTDVFDNDETDAVSRHLSHVSSGRMVKPSLGLLWTEMITHRLFLTREEGQCGVVRRMYTSLSPVVDGGKRMFVEVDDCGIHGIERQSSRKRPLA